MNTYLKIAIVWSLGFIYFLGFVIFLTVGSTAESSAQRPTFLQCLLWPVMILRSLLQ